MIALFKNNSVISGGISTCFYKENQYECRPQTKDSCNWENQRKREAAWAMEDHSVKEDMKNLEAFKSGKNQKGGQRVNYSL